MGRCSTAFAVLLMMVSSAAIAAAPAFLQEPVRIICTVWSTFLTIMNYLFGIAIAAFAMACFFVPVFGGQSVSSTHVLQFTPKRLVVLLGAGFLYFNLRLFIAWFGGNVSGCNLG